MQLPSGILLQTGGTSISFPLQQTTGQTAQTTQAQTIFGLPNQTQYLTMANLAQQGVTTSQADNTTIVSSSSSSSSSATSLTSVPSNISLVSASGSGTSGGLMTPNLVMYHTPQGVLYTTPASATLGERTIFNFQQPATAISLPQQDNAQVGAGQLIIPIPVSLSGSGQQFLQFASPTEHSATTTTVADLTVQAPRPKKSRSK